MLANGFCILVDVQNTLATPEVGQHYPATAIGRVNEAKEHFFAICIELAVKFRVVSTMIYAINQSLVWQ